MSFKAQIKASLGWDWSEGVRDNGRLDYAKSLSDGIGDNQAEAAWHLEQQTLLLGDWVDYDLTNLTRTVLGVDLSTAFAAIKALLLFNESTDGGELRIGGAAEDPWSAPLGGETESVLVPADSVLLLSSRQSGWIVDSAARHLRLTASGGDVTYSLAVVGTLSASDSSSGSGT
ncbi:MAG: hypothetical protein ABFC54_01730 [Thermoguttaceae bacterium]